MRARTRRGAWWLAGVWAVAVVLPAVVMAGPARAATPSFTDSSVAFTGHAVVVAAVNNAGNLDYWQQDGSTTWDQQVVAKCCYSNTVPAIAQTGSTVSIVENGLGGQVTYYSLFDGICLIPSTCPQGWHKQVVATAPRGTYYGPVTISWTGSKVIIAAEHSLAGGSDAATVLDYWYSDGGTGAWHEEQVATHVGYNGSGQPSIGWANGTVIITDTDPNGGVDYWYQYAGTRPWHQQQVAPAGSLSGGGGFWNYPVISWTGYSVVIAAINEDADLDYWYQDAGTSTWHQQQVAGPGSVAPYGPPAIAWTGRSVVLTDVTENGTLNFWAQAAHTSSWRHAHVATLSPAGDEYFAPSIAAGGGQVFITDSDGSDGQGGNLDYWWKQIGTTDWHQQQVAAG